MNPPTLQALLLADHVYKDANTGKFVIAGTFRNLWAREFPSQFAREVHAFVSLTNLRGKTSIHLRYVHLKELKVLVQTPDVEIESKDPLATLELSFLIPGLPMPEPGPYSFELHADGELVGSLRVVASEIEHSSDDSGPPPEVGT